MIHLIDKFVENLKGGRYNQATIHSYRNSLFKFYTEFREVPERQITDQMISDYLKDLQDKKGVPSDAIIQHGKAITLFYDKLFGRKLNVKATGKFKSESTIDTLTKTEIEQLIENTKNIKHKTLFALVYASGLRLSELINLKITDLNMSSNELYISSTVKANARTIQLAQSLKPLLEAYLTKCSPKDSFFEGEKGKSYSARSIQLIFQSALKKAGVEKNATIHSLRHSYAVHLLEYGIDIHHVKEILGHKNVQSTSMYMPHVKFELKRIKSPMDY